MESIKFTGVLLLGVIIGTIVVLFFVKKDYQDKLDYKEMLNEDSQEQIKEAYQEKLNVANELLKKDSIEKLIREYKTYQVNDLKEFMDALRDDRIIEILSPINITKDLSQIAPLDSLKFNFLEV